MKRILKRDPYLLSAPPALSEEGLALVIALIALSLMSLLGIYVALNSSDEIRVSDNYESEIQARFAARAGLNHARDLLRGIQFDDLLRGPDGDYNSGAAYLSQARTLSYRNPIHWATARSLDILNPAADVSGVSDDGLINTGKTVLANGTILIPITGISHTVNNPYGPGTITLSRYFVKVTDNNGEVSELERDVADNPFTDGDGVVIIRSIGVARTLREKMSGVDRLNSIAAYEARFKRRRTFQLDAALVVEGADIQPASTAMFVGSTFRVQGDGDHSGVATIDTDPSDLIAPADRISANIAADQQGNILGLGLRPSIRDITGILGADPDKALLLDRAFIWNFVTDTAPQFADSIFTGTQNWASGLAPDIGSYDTALPMSDPRQRPKTTLVNGDLAINGDLRGGGLLVVAGKLTVNGRFEFNGLILVVGRGEMEATGWNPGVKGGILLSSLFESGGSLSWGIAKLTLGQDSLITFDSQAIQMAISLIPPMQVGFRRVTSALDP